MGGDAGFVERLIAAPSLIGVAGLVRRAGRGTLADGSLVVWSVAEGAKGRRWREVRTEAGIVVSSLLLETDADGRFSHTELSTAAGLLTLHPERDGTLHGNVVTTDGVRHVVGRQWDVDAVLLLEGSPIAAAAARFASPGDHGYLVRLDLTLEPLEGGAGKEPVAGLALDADGLPILDAATTWPLELD